MGAPRHFSLQKDMEEALPLVRQRGLAPPRSNQRPQGQARLSDAETLPGGHLIVSFRANVGKLTWRCGTTR